MQFSSYSKMLILVSIQFGVTYALFPCKDPDHPGVHQALCARPLLPWEVPKGVPAKEIISTANKNTVVAPAVPSQGSFTCGHVLVNGRPSVERKCCLLPHHVAPNDYAIYLNSDLANNCYNG
ncbi:hypothetical protein MJO29_013619 [Puccinia striiformis f. sp. tritici]|uniref:Secreted protein n=5 Tax=Puccinia striiformis TaxID=27350 RepID=A0A0L0V0F9_9BASI|nr:hypothetical protein Pst134EA_025681 [Puccinia striiformis f. sp. tritici]KAI9628369.1 hypothetical protein KEM48_011652 [Puccinia striiformis f. sp. tritici PST-130]KNE92777.1 hypothetical protein PSTG_13834 [Puccinia striiformis f. sp. tritici PST-78]POW00677.1 hypothetical protein PSHT_12908 [Puccinia striiformis]KAH9443913.1 hypothetical protein Pst134EB_026303 [Puccinia striiformis f. sp. tritici]KAH9451742.1 hypothetical protein Pst134EA_025681 [Puccinia striiformis f. sp. tritici]